MSTIRTSNFYTSLDKKIVFQYSMSTIRTRKIEPQRGAKTQCMTRDNIPKKVVDIQ